MRYRALIVSVLALCFGLLTACSDGPANATTALTYEEVRGTGIANTCPQLETTRRGSIPLESGEEYVLTELCMEPTNFFVKEESISKRKEAEFIAGKPMTRMTSSLDQVKGKLTLGADGTLTFEEQGGFDFQAVTVKMPSGELVPFLFTVKGLVASSAPGFDGITTSTDFEGEYRVPSYRTSNFLDPKGRGLTAGYDNAVALPSRADSEELLKENLKQFDTGKGRVSFQVAKINSATGEIAGTFESIQPSDTDMGGKAPLDVKIRGLFYARVEPAQV
ncbi:MAG: photosystem II manganese-stabilizing polypeptide [Pegethrix bostrychoides GSE-TBD4-15B]|jgi:photosystem II oxygen-evolving enhancer protein 1|uniref:Photosystem II extrinsic protein O n=1 Tax=Pegethrix bostrychoides GSE-TBD4-15B TaxID=2839662 RepID=A0A951P8B8_9CYAN|nr:photosystem II manganese-stabilizing polypeptide [Pegethrix bostrychoides GSE-TBD4-15B]